MPVQRFRTTEEAREALWCAPREAETVRCLRRLLETMDRLAPAAVPRGVSRFRSIDDANRERAGHR